MSDGQQHRRTVTPGQWVWAALFCTGCALVVAYGPPSFYGRQVYNTPKSIGLALIVLAPLVGVVVTTIAAWRRDRDQVER